VVVPWHLVWKSLGGHPLRSLLTLGSLVIAVFLICVLRALIHGMQAGVSGAAPNRLVVQSAVSLFVSLPLSYQGKIDQVQGVATSTKFQWFGGYYQEPANFFAQFGVDHDRFFDAYPEVSLVQGTPADFKRTRTACLIGEQMAKKFGFTIGSKVPITGTIFSKRDGTAWDFEVAGIYHSTSANVDNNTLFFHYDYLHETIEQGGSSGPNGTGVYMLKLAPGTDPARVQRDVDALFENGPQRVQTTTEAEFQRQFVSMMGSVPTFLTSIGGAVLFAIFLAVLNTMLMAGRERTRDIGILKALGFGDAVMFTLLMSESLLLCGLGGGLGVALAVGTAKGFGESISTMVPFYEVSPGTIGLGLGLSLGLGLVAGLGPALRASRLPVVQAIRPEA
jgi:putative ABC transport system permease protein